MEIAVRLLGDDHPKTARAQIDLGGVLVSMDRLTEAEAVLLPAFDVTLAANGPDHPATTSSAKLVVDLYEKMNQPDKADPYRQYLE